MASTASEQKPDATATVAEKFVQPKMARRASQMLWSTAVQKVAGWAKENDCTKTEALEALTATQGVSQYFRGFSTVELEQLASMFTFVSLRLGEKVIQRGERATFFRVLEKRVVLGKIGFIF